MDDYNIYSEFEKYKDEWPDIIVMRDAYKLPGFPYTKFTFDHIGRQYPLCVLKNKKVIPNTVKKFDLLNFLFEKKNNFDNYLTNKIKKIVASSCHIPKNELISICMKFIPANSAFRICKGNYDKDEEVRISIGRRGVSLDRINYLIKRNILYEKNGNIYLK